MGEIFPETSHSFRLLPWEAQGFHSFSFRSAIGEGQHRVLTLHRVYPSCRFQTKICIAFQWLYFRVVAKTLDHLEKKVYSALSWSLGGNKSCQIKLSCHCHFCSPSSFLVHYSPLLTLFLSHHMSKRPAIPGITLNSPTHKVEVWYVLLDFVWIVHQKRAMISWFCVKFSNIPWKNPTKNLQTLRLETHRLPGRLDSEFRLEHEEASPVGGGLALPDLPMKVSWNDGKVNINLGVS